MPLSSAEFLQMACALAFERGTRLIEDDDFLPKLREQGLTDEDIARYKEELERSHDIRNHHVIDGMKNFDIRRGAFHRYVRTLTGPEIMRQAQAIFKRWKSGRNGALSAAELARELDIPELHAKYLLDLLTYRPRH
jgi:hypothetical protein